MARPALRVLLLPAPTGRASMLVENRVFGIEHRRSCSSGDRIPALPRGGDRRRRADAEPLHGRKESGRAIRDTQVRRYWAA